MKDRYYMTYILFYAFGTLSQVPSHFFITATDYWMYKFRNPAIEETNHENRTGLQASFTSSFSIVSAVSHVIFFVVTLTVLGRFSIVRRIVGTLCGTIVLFFLTLVFVEINTDLWQEVFLGITLIIGFLLTGFGAMFMLTVFEMLTKFPLQYLPVLLTGQALCGVFSALTQVLALSIGTSSKTDGFVYFFIGTVFVILTLISFLVILKKSKFFQFHLSKVVESEKPKITKQIIVTVLKKVKIYMIALFIIMGSTVMIHPAVTSLVVSKNKGNGNHWNDIYFVPVVTFLMYNLFDYMGREAATAIAKPKSDIAILGFSLCRVFLVPFLIFCNAHPRKHLPVVFGEDYAYIIFIIMFALSHGYLLNLCAIQIPKVVNTDELKIAMYVLLIFMIVSGMGCSFISIAMIKAL